VFGFVQEDFSVRAESLLLPPEQVRQWLTAISEQLQFVTGDEKDGLIAPMLDVMQDGSAETRNAEQDAHDVAGGPKKARPQAVDVVHRGPVGTPLALNQVDLIGLHGEHVGLPRPRDARAEPDVEVVATKDFSYELLELATAPSRLGNLPDSG
jgi:hypothetical protein